MKCIFEVKNIRLIYFCGCVGIVGTGTVTVVSAAGAFGIGAGIFWYLKKVRAKAPVTCGVQSNDNRLF